MLGQGAAIRLRWVIPYALAVAAVAVTSFAIIIVATAFTERMEPLVLVSIFVVVPILSLWAFVTGVSASLRVVRVSRFAVVVGSLGVLSAGGAHLWWYSAMDAEYSAIGSSLWIPLVALAIGLISFSVILMLWPAFSRSMSAAVATLLAVVTGLACAAGVVATLALPLTAPMLAIAALVIVMLLHRNSRLPMRSGRVSA